VDIVDTALNSVVGIGVFVGCVRCSTVFSDEDHRSIFCFVLAILDFFLFLVLFIYDIIGIYMRYAYDAYFFLYMCLRIHTRAHTI
jgi:hypothetical protein